MAGKPQPNQPKKAVDKPKPYKKITSPTSTLAVAGGFIAGSTAVINGMQVLETIAAIDIFALQGESAEGEEALKISNNIVDVPVTELPVQPSFAQDIDQQQSFAKAYTQAREQLGAGGVFSWHGNLYNTYTSDEWASLNEGQRNSFVENSSAFEAQAFVQVHAAPEEVHQNTAAHHNREEYHPRNRQEENERQSETREINTETQAIQNTVAREITNIEEEIPVVTAVDETIMPEVFDQPPVFAELAQVDDPQAAAAGVQISAIDIDGDKIQDGLKLENDSNDGINISLVDRNKDGVEDAIYYDTNKDDKPEMVVYDNNEDGVPDEADPLGNAPKDDFDINNPDMDDFNPNADASDWQ